MEIMMMLREGGLGYAGFNRNGVIAFGEKIRTVQYGHGHLSLLNKTVTQSNQHALTLP
jgi:hypothetical protein